MVVDVVVDWQKQREKRAGKRAWLDGLAGEIDDVGKKVMMRTFARNDRVDGKV